MKELLNTMYAPISIGALTLVCLYGVQTRRLLTHRHKVRVEVLLLNLGILITWIVVFIDMTYWGLVRLFDHHASAMNYVYSVLVIRILGVIALFLHMAMWAVTVRKIKALPLFIFSFILVWSLTYYGVYGR